MEPLIQEIFALYIQEKILVLTSRKILQKKKKPSRKMSKSNVEFQHGGRIAEKVFGEHYFTLNLICSVSFLGYSLERTPL